MTADEHERYYAGRSGMTIDEIRKKGGYSVHCDCDSPGCPGRSMVFAQRPDEWLEAIRLHVERGRSASACRVREVGSPGHTARWFAVLAALAEGSKGAKALPPACPS